MDINKFNTVEDFVEDISFRDWVLKPEGENNLLWKNFLSVHPEKAQLIYQAKSIVFALQIRHETITDEEVSYEVDRFKNSIGLPLKKQIHFFPKYFFSIAAAILLLLSVSFLFFIYKPVKSNFITNSFGNLQDTWVEKSNNTGKPLEVILNDGSTVTLQSNSKISYPAVFEKYKREIKLVGEAFFDVKRDASKPFFVYSQDLVTKVLGTSFTVKAYNSEEKIQVSVKTGKVSVVSKNNFDKENEKNRFPGLWLNTYTQSTSCIFSR